MRKSRIPVCIGILACLASATCRKTKLEHFKFYEVPPRPFLSTDQIHLQGQMETTPVRAGIIEMTHFGNPVQKAWLTRTPTPSDEQPPEPPDEDEVPPPTPTFPRLENPSHHLTWYKLNEKGGTYYVGVTDQFGRKDIIFADPVAMLVPARKHDVGGAAPKGLNHFKCYNIIQKRGASPEPVILRDQFDRPNVDVNVAENLEFLCMPVTKLRDDKWTPKGSNRDGFDHLLIYRLGEREPYGQKKTVTDQIFANNALAGFRSHYLAVPAKKGFPVTAAELPTLTPTRRPTPTRTPPS